MQQEMALLDRAEIFWSGDQFSLARLPVSAFNQGVHSWVKLANSLSDSLQGPGLYCSHMNTDEVIYNDFEKLSSRQAFSGSGARYLKKGTMDLFSEELYERFAGEEVELSFWLYVDHRTDNMPVPVLWFRDENDRLVRREKLNSRKVHNVDGMWVRISKKLIPDPGIRVDLTVNGNYITIDDLMIKPVDVRVVVRHENGDLLLDNYRVPIVTDR